MLLIRCGDRDVAYFSLSEASSIITHNLWDSPVEGLHSETLRRTFRDKGKRHGIEIGRDIFFTAQHLKELGYKCSETPSNYIPIGDVVQLFPTQGDVE